MRRNTLVLFLGLLGLIVQGVFVGPPLIMCNVAVLFVVFFALERSFLTGAIMAMVLGYLSDVILGSDRGLYMGTMVMVFVCIRFLVAHFQGGKAMFVTLICALSSFLCTLIAINLERLVGTNVTTISLFSLSTAAIVITGSALGYPVYKSLKVLDERFHEPEDDFVFKE